MTAEALPRQSQHMKHAFGALAIGSSLWAGGALAHAPEQSLAQCVAPLPDTPDLVQEQAQAWLRHGGGRDARDCLAQADLSLGAYREAALEYRTLSAGSARDSKGATADSNRNDMYAEQEAGAWLLAGDGKAAEQAARLALERDPARLGLRLLLARSLVMQNDFAGGIAALGALPVPESAGGAVDPFLVRALVTRASAYRQLGQNDKGLADANKALALEHDNIEALLERGILEARLAHYAEARHDWDQVIALSPDGHAAYLARQDEAVMDSDPDQN
ncbi:tetratricopeptide repeat protein [Asaia sp. HN010]|uniref:tetratricopeptide repeat protein n=1 Tax=Asaia sp. HN010 TaxID=3081233 RepID=UPI0030165CCB